MSKPFLVGTYTANCAVFALPVADVQKMLVSDCALAPQTVAPAGQHPVILMMGDEQNVSAPWMSIMPPVQYLETTLAVPWVVYTSDPAKGVMAHASRLWLNKLMPTIGGRVVGFPKIMTRIRMEATDYHIRTWFLRRRILSSHYLLSGAPGAPESFPNYAPIAPIFQQVFLQKMFCMWPTVSMVMSWDMTGATMQPLHVTFDAHADCDPGIPPGKYDVPSIDVQSLGGFRLTVGWQLGWPRLM